MNFRFFRNCSLLCDTNIHLGFSLHAFVSVCSYSWSWIWVFKYILNVTGLRYENEFLLSNGIFNIPLLVIDGPFRQYSNTFSVKIWMCRSFLAYNGHLWDTSSVSVVYCEEFWRRICFLGSDSIELSSGRLIESIGVVSESLSGNNICWWMVCWI